jgi:5-methyltetrahydrofolate--homocysteine methyltransferase
MASGVIHSLSADDNQSPFVSFLNEQIACGKPVFFDGGMGTMIQASGVTGYSIPEDLNFSHPDVIKKIYRGYLDAGSNVITANSFGANPLKLEAAAHTAEAYITQSIKLIKEAIAECEAAGNKHRHFAAWDTGQIGKLLEPMGSLTFDEAYESYKTAVVAAAKAGADLAIIETMSDLYEVKAAVLAVKENTSLPIVASMTFQPTLRTLTGADVLTCVTYLEALGVNVLGFNCGGSLAEDAKLTEQFCSYAHIPVLVQPNAGLPTVVNGKTIFKVSPEEFAAAQLANRAAGVTVLGGCCGTTPAHISAMISTLAAEDNTAAPTSDCYGANRSCSAEQVSAKDSNLEANTTNTYICSYNKTVQCGGSAGPVIIGERINPTGKKKCKEALLAGDMQFVLGEAESQINAGAHILDVNVGLPGIDEAETMKRAVKTIQSTFNTPLQIDSSEPAVLEKALRSYNGKALVNSVNGKQETMDKVFPLIKKYGGSVVALCIDENGIAPTAEGRVAVAKKIISEAAKYGIPPRDIFIDTLTLTVSSEQKTALETVRAITLLSKEYHSQGLRFVLGVSNISFGLPRRDIINSRFLELALYAGLTACIINPLSEPMMDSFRAYRTLAGYDTNCLDFIEKYTGSVDPTSAAAKNAVSSTTAAPANGSINQHTNTAPVMNVAGEKAAGEQGVNQGTAAPSDLTSDEASFISIIEKGFKDKAAAIAEKLLETKQPVEIINRCIVPALDSVGKDFETGKKFLPQLLLSADTVGNAFAVIKAKLASSGVKQEHKGTIAIATVYGDIHDIGKNIVKAMLENYGYTVIDLGKNVPSEKIIATVFENDIQLVGLSALMTTTVSSMEKTICELRKALAEKNKKCKIMVGGAVLTEEYAAKIGADFYSKDAMGAVSVAKEVFGK